MSSDHCNCCKCEGRRRLEVFINGRNAIDQILRRQTLERPNMTQRLTEFESMALSKLHAELERQIIETP